MDGNFKVYSYTLGSSRIVEILDQPAGQFEEVDGLPHRDTLTYTNGYYGMCAAVFVDIRNSSGLTQKYTRPRLAKLYRAFISEMVAVLNAEDGVREVNIVGDCVWATYSTPYMADIDDVFRVAYQANTLVQLLNVHLKAREYEPVKVGIGVDYGRVLMIKAGYKGSGINDVVYMGEVVNRAAHLAHEGGRGYQRPIWVGSDFRGNLNEHNQGLLTRNWTSALGEVYVGDVVHTEMNNWIDENL